jgi:hypothetical protein
MFGTGGSPEHRTMTEESASAVNAAEPGMNSDQTVVLFYCLRITRKAP